MLFSGLAMGPKVAQALEARCGIVTRGVGECVRVCNVAPISYSAAELVYEAPFYSVSSRF